MIKNSNLNIVFMGPPGVGKGTIASFIAEKYHIYHLSTGNVFREEIASKSALGLEITSLVESGKYVPDDITNKVVEKKIKSLQKAKKQVMLDGYPRTLEQVKFLDSIQNFNYVVIELTASEELILKRLSGRRQCPNCKTNYHVAFMPPKIENVCDNCQHELIIRKDDQVEAIKIRQQVYHSQTEPLLAYYKKEGKLHTFDASGEASQTAEKIIKDIFEK